MRSVRETWPTRGPVGSLSSVTAGKPLGSSPTSCGEEASPEISPGAILPIRVLLISSGSRSTRGTSYRGSPAPVGMAGQGSSGRPLPGVLTSPCTTSAGTGVRQQYRPGACLHPRGKMQSRIGGEAQRPAPRSPIIRGATSSLPASEGDEGFPFAGTAAAELGRNATLRGSCIPSYFGMSRDFALYPFVSSCIPCFLCQTTEKRVYFCRGILPVG